VGCLAPGNLSPQLPFSSQASVFHFLRPIARNHSQPGEVKGGSVHADYNGRQTGVQGEFAQMFSIVAVSFAGMVASAAAALNFPALELPWILSAATAVIFLGAFEAWNLEVSAPADDDVD
jgi:hypothetical protein